MSESDRAQFPVTVEFVDERGFGYSGGRYYNGDVQVRVAGHLVLRLGHSFSVNDSENDDGAVGREVAARVERWIDRIEDVVAAAEHEDEHRRVHG